MSLVIRGAEIHGNVKYWIKPDLENRIKEGSIRAFFNTVVERVTERTIVVKGPGGVQEIDNDWVLAMTGYHPDYPFLESLGIRIGDDVYAAEALAGPFVAVERVDPVRVVDRDRGSGCGPQIQYVVVSHPDDHQDITIGRTEVDLLSGPGRGRRTGGRGGRRRARRRRRGGAGRGRRLDRGRR